MFRAVITQSVILTVAGIMVGTALAPAVTRYLQALLFGIESADAPTYVTTAVLLVVATVVACYGAADEPWIGPSSYHGTYDLRQCQVFPSSGAEVALFVSSLTEMFCLRSPLVHERADGSASSRCHDGDDGRRPARRRHVGLGGTEPGELQRNEPGEMRFRNSEWE